MCGISGFNWKDETKVAEMVNSLSHRGPDAMEVYVDDVISLGHNRLSIIDLSPEANQPMFSNDKKLVIVYNGEIYNFKELKKELEGGYNFKTESDTEVILAGYKKWGKRVVERLNGMFAFAIWDKDQQEIFCARDHTGIKPFYYYFKEGKFIFASEMRTILEHNIPRKLNKEAFNHYLRILYTPEPMTLVDNVYKLAPSHTLLLGNGTLTVEKYGGMKVPASTLTYSEATTTLKGKVLKAVERHLVSDVPVGVYLSGGIDSSLVLYAMTRFQQSIETFSIGFEDVGEKFNKDVELAGRTAGYFGVNHKIVNVSANDVVERFEEISKFNSDPISNPTFIAMYLLAEFARKSVTVALTGNAGDELFGGYDRYKTALVARFLYNTPDLFAKFMFQKDEVLNEVVSADMIFGGSRIKNHYDKYLVGNDAVDSLINADRQSWLPEHFFMLSDHMSMAHALEERMPLADKELMRFSQSLSRKYKVNMSETKKILKDAFRDDLPEFLFNEPKRGWFSPAAKWLRDPQFSAFVREVLSEDYYRETQNIFNWLAVSEMLEDHIDGRKYNLTMLWAIITFQVWAREYKIKI